MTEPTLCIVDDDRHVREGLRETFEHNGYSTLEAKDGKEALAQIEEEPVDLVLLDLKLPRLSGMEVLREMAETHAEIPVIIVSGQGTIQKAVEATKLGAYDFLEKPVEPRRAKVTVENALEQARLRREREQLLEQVRERYEMVGSSEPMQRVYDRIERAAQAKAKVLITGENGTGKEMVARAIHRNSERASGPFVTVNCAAIPPDLIESELFGHEEGAFTGAKERREGTFEQADGGTLFLDEIGDMSLDVQAKTLRAIEREEVQRVGGGETIDVDVRIIAATNQDLGAAIEAGGFREDLYYRLDVVSIEVPPLRERRDDIPALAKRFLQQFSEEHSVERPLLGDAAAQELMRYDWPGNVRELRNAIEQLVVLHGASEIGAEAVRRALGIGEDSPDAPARGASDLRRAKGQFERAHIQRTLNEHDGSLKKTAEALGIDRSTLWRKMEQHGLETE
ncbi:MAG: sigma-54-dependent transcriptional regulator [Salinibacter sp.]|uniref:sigma-54-dependent transcriptional regulator n=1 Tax=Salinibacter sp. TaxID=2065818 RepID=UPI0035D47DDC